MDWQDSANIGDDDWNFGLGSSYLGDYDISGQFSLQQNQNNPQQPQQKASPAPAPTTIVESKPKVIPKQSKNVFTVRNCIPPNVFSNMQPCENLFDACMANLTFAFDPKALGFIPLSFWPETIAPFSSLVTDFFRKKNNPRCRFHYKLYNALKMTTAFPYITPVIGVEWISDYILLVHKNEFARLLGISTIEGCLFHKQGNFSAYGFVSPDPEEAIKVLGEEKYRNFDYVHGKLLVHKDRKFHRNCTESEIENCRWEKANK